MIAISSVLEVALGLAFLYMLMAILCSALNEWIAGILGLRSKTLRNGIANLLEDPNLQGLGQRFFDHPLIKGTARPGKTHYPSYIAPHTFSLALLDLLVPERNRADTQNGPRVDGENRVQWLGVPAANRNVAKTLSLFFNDAGVDPRKLEDTSSALNQVQQMRNRLLDQSQSMNEAGVEAYQPIADSLFKLREVESALLQSESGARAAMTRAQDNLERYFDDAMERMSGAYKRRVQIILIVLAVLLTVALNADTLVLAQKLFEMENVRVEAATNAEEFAFSGMLQSLSVSPSGTFSATLASIDQLGLPIGTWDSLPTTQESWLYKILGLGITVVAVSMGAPFWFDVLSKVANLRMTGRKPTAAALDPRLQSGGLLAARLITTPETQWSAFEVKSVEEDKLRGLATRAVRYVDSLKNNSTAPGGVPKKDIAVAHVLMEATNQGVSATPAEIVQAIESVMS